MAKQVDNLPYNKQRPALSPLRSIYHHQLRIDKSLELITRCFQRAAFFVQSILSQNKCQITAICPYQFDFCIAVGKPWEMISNDYDDDSDDEDQIPSYDIEDQKPEYIDCIGDIEDKLNKNKLRYTSKHLNPSLIGYDLTARDFIDLLKELKAKYARSNPFEVDGNYVYPHKKRFIVMLDLRDINDQTVYIYEAPEKYRNIPNENASKWCVNATNACLLPGYDRKDDIGASSQCHGSLLTLSFHIFQEDEIKCYLGWNAKLCYVKPSDLKEVLPKIFNIEHSMTGIMNRYFLKKVDDDADDDYRYWFFTIDEMAEDINNVINGRSSYKCIDEAGNKQDDVNDQLDGDMLNELEYIVQLQDMIHPEIVSDESSLDLPDLNDDQHINNNITACPKRGSDQTHGQSGNYNANDSNSNGNQSHHSNNSNNNNFNTRNGNNRGSGGNGGNGGDGDDEKYNDHHEIQLVLPCAGCSTLLKTLQEKEMKLKQKDILIHQKDAMIMYLQTLLLNQIQSRGVPVPVSMQQQFNNYNGNEHHGTNRYFYRNENTFNTSNIQTSINKHKATASPPPLYTPNDIQSRSISIPSTPNSPQPEYLSRSISLSSVTSTTTLASVSTDSSMISLPTLTNSNKSEEHQYSYKPPMSMNRIRLNRNVYVPRGLTQSIISKMSTNFKDCKELYSWMDIDTITQFDRKENKLNESARILNFGFIDKDTRDNVYCVAEKKKQDEEKDYRKNKSKPSLSYKWAMIETLYTKQMVMDEFRVKVLPDTVNIGGDPRIEDYLADSKNWNNMINKTKWGKVKVFSKMDNKRINALTIIPEEFKKDIKTTNNKTKLKFIPIIMFIKDHYEVHHVLIAGVNGSNIAISFIYDEKVQKPQVKGIHIDKSLLQRQHQWASSLHHVNECKCFDHFNDNIDHLVIGTKKDMNNKMCNLKNMVQKLSKQNKILQIELDLYRDASTSPSEISYHSSLNSSSYSLKNQNKT